MLIWIVFPMINLTCYPNTNFGHANLFGSVPLLGALIATPTIYFHQGGAITIHDIILYKPYFFWVFAVLELMSVCLLLVHYFTFLGAEDKDNSLPETTRPFVRVVITLITFDVLLIPPFVMMFIGVPLIKNLSWLTAVSSLFHLIADFCVLYPLFRSGSKRNIGFYFIASIISAICDVIAPIITILVEIGSQSVAHKRSVQTGPMDGGAGLILVVTVVGTFYLSFVLARCILTIVSAVQARRIKNEVDDDDSEEVFNLYSV